MLIYLWVILIICIYAWKKWQGLRTRRYKATPPVYPEKLPILGHLHLHLGDNKHFFQLIKKVSAESLKQGGVTSFYIGPRITYAITDPDDCFTVCQACLKKSFAYEFAKPWVGNGILTSPVHVWKNHRKLLNPVFRQQILNGYIGVFNSQAQRLVNKLATEEGEGPFDHEKYLLVNGLETICQTALGIDLGNETSLTTEYVVALGRILNIMSERFGKFWLHPDAIYNLTKLKKKQDDALSVIHNMSRKIIEERKMEFGKGTNKKKDAVIIKTFIESILELTNDKGLLSDTELRENIDTIIFGGYDTSASVLTYTLMLLGSHKTVQEKAYKELQELFNDTEKEVDKQDLANLVYLEAVIKESMRLYPIAPVIGRVSTTDIKLKNYTIPTGSDCNIFFWGLHRHPIWGEDAEEFRPERWLDPNSLPANPNVFGGFSLGKRGCIGKTYAMMSMKINLVYFLRRYSVSADIDKLELKFDGILKPASGCFISIRRRD